MGVGNCCYFLSLAKNLLHEREGGGGEGGEGGLDI